MTGTTLSAGRVNLRLRSADDLVSAVPYVTGFHPRDSLVVLGFGSAAGTFTARFDLPPAGRAAAANALVVHIADLLVRNRIAEAALIGYGAEGRVGPLVAEARSALAERDVRLVDALRVEGGRYWSYLCRDSACCPIEGKAFDIASSRVAAEATLAGRVALPGRDALERSVAPVVGAERRSMREATAAAERRLLGWVREERDPGGVRDRMADEGMPLVHELIDRARHGETVPGDDDVAWLGVLLTDLRVRDEAWTSIDDEHLDGHIALWSTVVRRVEDVYVPAPGCLLAVAAWLGGHGALANVALDRAQRADDRYSLAALLREGLLSGMPPDTLRRIIDSGAASAEHGR